MKAKAKTGHRCLFCQMRSIALRLNRAKIRVNLKPVESLSQQDQFQASTAFGDSFVPYFYEILVKK